MGARSLADAIKKRAVGSLTIIFSRSVDLEIVAPPLAALQRQFGRLQLRLLRGARDEITEALKEGEADLAVAAGLEGAWERLDRWPLFEEPFVLVASPGLRLANRMLVELADLGEERLVLRPYCDSASEVLALLGERGIAVENCDEIAVEEDLATLLGAKVGAAVVPSGLADRGPPRPGPDQGPGDPSDGLPLRRCGPPAHCRRQRGPEGVAEPELVGPGSRVIGARARVRNELSIG